MPDMEYESGTLRDGARTDRASAAGARETEQALRAGSISAAAFGDVGNAARIAGQAIAARDAHASSAAAAGRHRDDQGDRADSAARQGDGLTGGTTSVASAAPKA